ncbi:MAG TPA: T9SS type A sorting domain-containing protein [Ignavibacteria bacterium]|nr:T9SS type A sorting domain-containing protein [Ignavibacteria bacterium]
MKKAIYTILTVFLSVVSIKSINAQGFTFTPLGSTFIQNPHYQDSVQVIQFRGIVKNTSTSPLNFRFARILNNLPSGWDTQMCYDLCYAPFVDTISLPGDPPYSIAPNHTDTLFYIDFTCSGQGIGSSIVRMFNTDNPNLYIQDTFKVQIGTVGINQISSVAGNYQLFQNYPNPFNPSTIISYQLESNGNVNLKVYDVRGKEVNTLVNQRQNAGRYNVEFSGNGMNSGVYFYKLEMFDEKSNQIFTETKSMFLIK